MSDDHTYKYEIHIWSYIHANKLPLVSYLVGVVGVVGHSVEHVAPEHDSCVDSIAWHVKEALAVTICVVQHWLPKQGRQVRVSD